MRAPAKAVPSTNGTSVDGKKVKQLLGQLNQMWQGLHALDLDTRHQTGVLLNKLLGPPAARQDYGKKVLAKVSEQLALSTGELSRMRHFAEKFPDLAKLRKKQPNVTWTEIRTQLPGLAKKKAGKAKTSPKPAALRKLSRSLEGAVASFRQLGSSLDDEQKAKLKQQVEDILKAASRCLKVHWSVVER